MNKILLILSTLIMSLNAQSSNKLDDSFLHIENNHESFRLLFKKPTTENKMRVLWLEHKNTKSLIWKSQFSKKSSIYSTPVSKDPYIASEILHATLKDDVLLVLFRINKKSKGIERYKCNVEFTADIPSKYKAMSIFDPKILTDGCNYLLRSFVKSPQGKWSPYISCYTKTFWTDTYFDDVVDLKIEDKNTYAVSFRGQWNIITAMRSTYKIYKSSRGSENTVKKLTFDKETGLLLTQHKGKNIFVQNAFWWSGFDEFNNNNTQQQVFSEYRKKAKTFKLKPHKAIYIQKSTMDNKPLTKDTIAILEIKAADYLLPVIDNEKP